MIADLNAQIAKADSSSTIGHLLHLATEVERLSDGVAEYDSSELISTTAEVGAVRYQSDGTMRVYTGQAWDDVTNTTYQAPFFQGSNYGYVIGGQGGRQILDRFSFASDGNAVDVGDVPPEGVGTRQQRGHSSSANGYMSGGFTGSYGTEDIGKFPFASTSTDVSITAELVYAARFAHPSSSETYGYSAGGRGNGPGAPTPMGPDGGSSGTIRSNFIQKFPFSSDDNATDIADLTQDLEAGVGLSSRDFGYAAGGRKDPSPAIVNVIERWSHTADENSTDVGDLTATTEYAAGISASTVGYSAGGQTDTTIIEKFTFASSSNATDVGTLTQVVAKGTGTSSTVSGYVAGGRSYPSTTKLNVIQKFPLAAETASTDVGDLTSARENSASAQF